jgi:predicted nucleic acid-binding protein
MSEFVFRHACIVLDADCTISLEASGQMESVIMNIPCRSTITRYVHRNEILRANLQPLIDGQALTIVDLAPDEEDTMINLSAVGLDNGEASAGAVAIHRNWAIGIDDGSARKYLAKHYPQIQLISVVDLVKHWIDLTSPALADVKAMLNAIEEKGGYRPGPKHPLCGWWNTYLSG